MPRSEQQQTELIGAGFYMVLVAIDRMKREFDDKLDGITRKLNQIQQKETTIMADLTQLTADVAANTDVDQSAITLLQGLKAALDAAGTDPAALAALSQSLQDSSTALAAAVVQNTPAA